METKERGTISPPVSAQALRRLLQLYYCQGAWAIKIVHSSLVLWVWKMWSSFKEHTLLKVTFVSGNSNLVFSKIMGKIKWKTNIAGKREKLKKKKSKIISKNQKKNQILNTLGKYTYVLVNFWTKIGILASCASVRILATVYEDKFRHCFSKKLDPALILQ